VKRIGSMAARGPAPAQLAGGLVLVLVVLAAVPGCASGPAPRPAGRQSPQAAGQAPAGAMRAARELLTEDVPGLRQKWELGRGEQRLVAACMRRLGLRYFAPSPGPQPAAATVTQDAAAPRRHATYGVVPGTGQAGADREDTYLTRLPGPQRARYSTALLGTRRQLAAMKMPGGGTVTYGTGGCLSAARRQLFGSVAAFARDSYLPQVMDAQFGSFLASYRPYLAALRGWQRCMSSAGHRYATPAAAIEAIDALAARPGTRPGRLASAQRAAARADVACNRRTGLRLSRHVGLSVWVQSLSGKTLAQLWSVYRTRQRAVRAAVREVITGPTRSR
jgi:hypothetical protein